MCKSSRLMGRIVRGKASVPPTMEREETTVALMAAAAGVGTSVPGDRGTGQSGSRSRVLTGGGIIPHSLQPSQRSRPESRSAARPDTGRHRAEHAIAPTPQPVEARDRLRSRVRRRWVVVGEVVVVVEVLVVVEVVVEVMVGLEVVVVKVGVVVGVEVRHGHVLLPLCLKCSCEEITTAALPKEIQCCIRRDDPPADTLRFCYLANDQQTFRSNLTHRPNGPECLLDPRPPHDPDHPLVLRDQRSQLDPRPPTRSGSPSSPQRPESLLVPYVLGENHRGGTTHGYDPKE
ncbi:unnamed protein product [Gadus morhua 'NCC']